jgi:hypothetical protein
MKEEDQLALIRDLSPPKIRQKPSEFLRYEHAYQEKTPSTYKPPFTPRDKQIKTHVRIFKFLQLQKTPLCRDYQPGIHLSPQTNPKLHQIFSTKPIFRWRLYCESHGRHNPFAIWPTTNIEQSR